MSNDCSKKRDTDNPPECIPVNKISGNKASSSKVSPSAVDEKKADKLDSLAAQSEKTYSTLATEIVSITKTELEKQEESKQKLKIAFTIFFICFISTQYLVLVALLFIKAFVFWIHLNDALILTYMTAVFVETLSAILVMIKYAFSSTQEVKLIDILNNAISKYQKYKD